jgi:hypothetical protein
MISLSTEEKDIILDFYFRCGDEERINRGRDLIASNPEAAQLYAQLEKTLKQLDSVKYEPCPENLVELTVAKLKLAASSEQARLESLLAAEQRKTAQMETTPATTKRSFWRNFAEVAAVAAMILVVTSISAPSLSRMRQAALCRARLKNISEAIVRYANDHDGALPAVAMTTGSPWWNVGEQGAKNQSNTRHPWLLVKGGGYIDGKNFLCPGRKDAKAVTYTTAQLANYNDFPSRQHINYSFTLISGKSGQSQKGRKSILLGDLNPVFEQVFDKAGKCVCTPDKPTEVLIEVQLSRIMSANHAGRGQNLLFGDGSSDFKKTRNIFGALR